MSNLLHWIVIFGLLALPAMAAPVTGGVSCEDALLSEPTLFGLISSDDVGGCTIGAFTYNNFLYSSDAALQGETPPPASASIDVQLINEPGIFGFRFSSGYTPNTYTITHRISYTIDPPPPVILGGSLDLFEEFESSPSSLLASYFMPQSSAFIQLSFCGGAAFTISSSFICPPVNDTFGNPAELLVLTSNGPFTGQFTYARNVVGVLVEITQDPGESFPDFGVTNTTIPEPSTLGLVLGGLALLLLRRRR